MSIHVNCQCGWSCRAKDEHAGKRVRCPKCGQIIPVPGKPRAAYDVFISHSNADKTTADAICAALESNRIRCWIAPRDILPGREWGEGIIDGINQCRVMILVFSTKSNQSKQVSREIERAVAKGLFVVPFRIEDVPMSKTMEYFLSSPHWLDAITPPFEKHLHILVQTVQSLLTPASQAGAVPQAANASTPPTAAPVGGAPLDRAFWHAAWTAHRRRAAWTAGALATSVLLVGLVVSTFSGRKPAGQGTADLIAASSRASGMAGESPSPVVLPPAPVPHNAQGSPGSGSAGKDESAGRSSAAVPPVDVTARASEAASSQFVLRGGPIVCRSEGLNVRFLSGGSRAEGDSPVANRLILVTNQRDMPVSEADQDMAADLSFQINNQSAETVTLSQIQVLLLGVVHCYEDQIAEPQAPRVAEPIEDLIVEEDSPPRKGYADLGVVFADDDTPRENLQYRIIENTNPDVATAVTTPQGKLDLSFATSQSGRTQIILAAVDHFELSAKCSFFVEVKPKTSPRPVEAAARPVPPGMDMSDPFAAPGSSDPFGVEPGAALASPSDVFKVEATPMFLGELVFAHVVGAGDLIASCSSGDLLPESKTEVLQPNRAKSFRVRIGCWTSNEVSSSESAADSLIGFADRRRRLAVNKPSLVEVQHLLAVCVRVNSEDGKSQDLYCDQLYRLTSSLRPAAQGRADSELQLGIEERLEDAASAVLAAFLKSHEVTLAYERAVLCGSVPDGFDDSAVSLFCYYADPASPFRATSSANLLSERDRCPRSNVSDVLACLQRENSALWRLLHGQLLQLAAGTETVTATAKPVERDPFGAGEAGTQDSDRLAAKAKTLQQELQAKRPARSLVRSRVRVETRPADDKKSEPPSPTSPPKPPEPGTKDPLFDLFGDSTPATGSGKDAANEK